jgi:hypothetical protein
MKLKIAVVMVGIFAFTATGSLLPDVSAQTLPINPLSPTSPVKIPGVPDLKNTKKTKEVRTFVDDLRDKGWIVIGPFEVKEYKDTSLTPVGLPDKKATPYSFAGKKVSIYDSSGQTTGYRSIQPGVLVIMAIKGNEVKLYVMGSAKKGGKNFKS